MSQVNKEIVSSLNQIRNQLGSLAPGDGDALVQIGAGLESLATGQAAEQTAEVSDVLVLTLEGLQGIYQEQVPDFGRAVKAMTAALVAAEQTLLSPGNPVCQEMMSQARRLLQAALGGGESAAADEKEKETTVVADTATGGVTTASQLSLDDVAALLIQLGPADRADLGCVRHHLKIIATDDDGKLPVEAKKQLVKAGREIGKILSRKSADPDESLADAGRLIEDALNAIAAPPAAGAVPKTEIHPVEEEEAAEESAPVEIPLENPAAVDEFDFEPASASDSEESSAGPESSAAGAAPAYEPDALPPDADRSLTADFIAESGEYIEAAEGALLQLETDPENLEAVNTVFRAFHTVKGTSAFLGLKRLSELAHHAESLLSRVRDREIRFTGGYADLALHSVDLLKEMLVNIQEALNGKPMDLPAGYADLMRVLINPEASGVSEKSKTEHKEAPRAPEAAPAAPVEEKSAAHAEKSRERSAKDGKRMRIGDVLVAQKKLTRKQVEAVAEMKGMQLLGETLVKLGLVSTLDIEEALQYQKQMAENETPAAAPVSTAAAAAAAAAAVPAKRPTDSMTTSESSVRVRTDRLDSLIDMVGELVIAQSMLAQDNTVLSGEYHELTRKISHAGKIVRELQDLSMGMRMVPLKATFQKMARLVRDMAQKCGKQVEFVTEGEETEIDRNMVDIIGDPLVHMVRNAIDHGIEMPDQRRESGKQPGGTVRLAAYHAGGNVVVELQDDGKGLDKDKILQKALDKGLVEPDKAMSEGEIFNLIFAPGFSTAEQVTDVSGRGVGMDVVRRNIEAMRGRVEISSEKGKGSTFTVRLPLTLAITDGMLVRVGSERFIVPTVNIHLSFSPPASALSTISGRGEMVLLRGELLPIIRLHRLFDVENAVEQTTKGLLMILADGRRRCALLVDELLGQQQVVAKSLGQAIGKIQGISGGAILGDGRVGLILDTAEIVALARQVTASADRKDAVRLQQQAA